MINTVTNRSIDVVRSTVRRGGSAWASAIPEREYALLEPTQVQAYTPNCIPEPIASFFKLLSSRTLWIPTVTQFIPGSRIEELPPLRIMRITDFDLLPFCRRRQEDERFSHTPFRGESPHVASH
jgi:hypothetical protein